MSINQICLDGKKVGIGRKPYIVAEMSGNHNGKLERALKIIEVAKECGADAVKIQTYRPNTITIDHDGKDFIKQSGLWKGRKLYDIYEEAHTPWEWHEKIFTFGKEIGITIFSSPFDNKAINLLEKLGNPIYKIASPELIDLPLIESVSKTKKPIIMSTGMATLSEITEAINTAKDNGAKDIIILHCTSAYPTPIGDSNLRTMLEISKKFNVHVGLSDHTEGTIVPIAASALGAILIEKHFTLNKKDGGIDSKFSIEPNELKELVIQASNVSAALGKVVFQPIDSEKLVLRNRRSLYAVKAIKKGEKLTADNIKSIRPGNGMLPKLIKEVLGKKAKRQIKYGEPLSKDMIEDL